MQDNYSLIQISNITLDEQINNMIVSIRPGVYCKFDKNIPSNARHFHRCYELCIVTDGNGLYYHDNDVYQLKRGDIFITEPPFVHEITVSTDQKTGEQSTLGLFFFMVYILENDNHSLFKDEARIVSQFLKSHTVHRHNQTNLIKYLDIILDNFKAYASDTETKKYEINQAIKTLVFSSLLAFTTQPKKAKNEHENYNNIIDIAQDYISTHIANKISLDNLAIYCNTSKRNLQTLFQKHLNTTITEYINNRRMSFASSLLRMNFRICDIGQYIGIEDSSQFCRIFKKYYGVTPKKYQSSYNSNGIIFGSEFK